MAIYVCAVCLENTNTMKEWMQDCRLAVICRPLWLMQVMEEREEAPWLCPVNSWMLLLLLSIPALYRDEDDYANHIEHQDISQEP